MLFIGTRKKKDVEVARLLREVVRSQRDSERRRDSRIDIAIVIAVVPYRDGEPEPKAAFVSVTKNISSDGVMLVVNKYLSEDELLVGFPGTGAISYVTAQILYRGAMPLGCFKLGLALGKLVESDRYPELQHVGQRSLI